MNKELIEKLLDDLIVSSVSMKNALQADDLMTFYQKSRDLMNAIEILKRRADLSTPLTPRLPPRWTSQPRMKKGKGIIVGDGFTIGDIHDVE